MKSKQLSELAEVFAGITVSRHQPKRGEASKQVRLYKASQCVSAIEGRLSAPMAASVSESFDKPKQELRSGDILLPSRFTRPGCGVKDSKEGGIYASENIFVVRAADPVVSKFLSIYFSSEVGKSVVGALSKEVPSYKAYAINAGELRSLALPDFDREHMLKTIEVNEQRLKTQGKLARQADVLSHLLSDSGKEVTGLLDVTGDSSIDFSALQMSKDALVFLSAVDATDISSSTGEVKVAVGKSHSIIKTDHNTCIVENIETGGLLVVQDNEVLVAKGITVMDKEKFRQLAEMTANFLQSSLVSTPTEVTEALELD